MELEHISSKIGKEKVLFSKFLEKKKKKKKEKKKCVRLWRSYQLVACANWRGSKDGFRCQDRVQPAGTSADEVCWHRARRHNKMVSARFTNATSYEKRITHYASPFREWAVNQHRDSYASYIGHHSLLAYSAVAENESIGRLKYQYLQKMLSPCGKPPKKEDD